MTSKIKIYRMLNEKPSIYVEIIDLSGPVDLELYLGSKLIETAYNKHSNYTFEIKDSGVYSVTAKSHDSLQLNSNSLRFLMENFQPNLSFKSLEESRPINFSVDEPEIDNINKFYIEVKVTKNRIKMV
ncbi:TPA: hypothetical protein QH070_001478, partial [Klebsiella aerogenes]|nr:hypothetical protein [Klebsiella aerogenes]HDU5290788.1 hypothetical protein [Klebsiella aerogenes]